MALPSSALSPTPAVTSTVVALEERALSLLILPAQESEEDDGIFLECPELLWVRSTYPAGSSVAGDLCQGRGECLTAMATASAASRPKIIVIIFFPMALC